ncbi:8-amino-7-oxononanoate synthase [uncultured Marinobacter sp.]|uniref:8-amino-7-oxononanoate synthase n=1 Tax=uncultured Marinobacter sp. TaxID=187379 RepID=UPI0030DA680B
MRDFAAEIEQRKAAGLYRSRRLMAGAHQPRMLADGRPLLGFCSNDYLGLASHPSLVASARDFLKEDGLGGASSHLICGHHQGHHRLEERLADYTQRSSALFFSTGYMANVGVITAVAGKGDTLFSDELNHASIIDGCRLSGATVKIYRHGDVEHLASLMAATEGHKVVVTDGVFSMDGNIAPLKALADLCCAHDALLVVDDAHGFGCVGPQGRGAVLAAGLSQSQVPLVVGTLGKAFGASGAFVAGPELLLDYLVQKARAYIYTTAMPPALARAAAVAVDLAEQGDDRRAHLQDLITRFRVRAEALGYALMPSATPIQPIMIGDAHQAMAISKALEEQGLLVTAIRPPTVPAGQSRLRVTFSASHTHEDLDRLLAALAELAPASRNAITPALV